MKNNRNQLGQFTKGWIPAQKIFLSNNQEKSIKEMYLDKKMSCTEISKILGYSTSFICDFLNKWQIMRNPSDSKKIYFSQHQPWNKGKTNLKVIAINKEELYHLYVEKKIGIKNVAETLGKSYSTIRNRLLDYGWIRNSSEAQIGHKIDKKTKRKISKSLKTNLENRWRDNELSILYKFYENEDQKSIINKLSNRSWSGITTKARELGLLRNHEPWNKGKSFLALEKNPNWKGGKSFELYGLAFNNNLKEKIRGRDNYRCQECFRHQDELYDEAGKKYKLNVHHIDYDKNNNIENNLISLCKSCHSQTNFKREDWTKYYKEKLCR